MAQAKKKRMIVICPHPEHMAPGQRLKYEQYFDYFRENNIEITVKPFITGRFQDIIYKKGRIPEKIFWTIAGYIKRFFLIFSLRKYDVSYIFLWVTPLGPPFFEWIYTRISRKVIYDIDDLVYLRESASSANKIISGLKGRKKPIFLMRKAGHVITCTPFLDSFVRKYNSKTTDISSTINTDKYKSARNYSIDNRKLVLGWSGSHSTSRYLYLLGPVFRQLSDEGLPFRLIVMGDENFKIDGIEIEAIPWKESYEIEVIKKFDIGLYPLPDEPWVYGKSGLKALQYMAAGIPTIATAIGTNFRIIENGDNGFLVKTNEEWIDCIKRLSNDNILRKQIGEKGMRTVESRFSINANKDTYLSIIDQVIAS
jgi:glycosyltransferase involved in cell wall biosynthesis